MFYSLTLHFFVIRGKSDQGHADFEVPPLQSQTGHWERIGILAARWRILGRTVPDRRGCGCCQTCIVLQVPGLYRLGKHTLEPQRTTHFYRQTCRSLVINNTVNKTSKSSQTVVLLFLKCKFNIVPEEQSLPGGSRWDEWLRGGLWSWGGLIRQRLRFRDAWWSLFRVMTEQIVRISIAYALATLVKATFNLQQCRHFKSWYDLCSIKFNKHSLLWCMEYRAVYHIGIGMRQFFLLYTASEPARQRTLQVVAKRYEKGEYS